MKTYTKPSVEEIKLTGIEMITAGGQAGGASGSGSDGSINF